MTVTADRPVRAEDAAFRLALRADWLDDDARLIYADWLDEDGRPGPAARLRWWVGARRAVRAGVAWDRPAGWARVGALLKTLHPEWVRRLYAVEIAHTVRAKWPLGTEWARVVTASDDTLAVAERYALLLATGDELSAAGSAARSAARSAAEILCRFPSLVEE